MEIINLTNPDKEPVEGDKIMKKSGGLTLTYTHSDHSLGEEYEAKEWRNMELMNTDHIAKIPDWPNRDKYIAYRQKLRDWPSTEDFPKTKPELET
tara:strand:- start:596 stop:880 length:285 start_codon:yes stop_codon:yes gene_type:complete